jgi:hypothetical protein
LKKIKKVDKTAHENWANNSSGQPVSLRRFLTKIIIRKKKPRGGPLTFSLASREERERKPLKQGWCIVVAARRHFHHHARLVFHRVVYKRGTADPQIIFGAEIKKKQKTKTRKTRHALSLLKMASSSSQHLGAYRNLTDRFVRFRDQARSSSGYGEEQAPPPHLHSPRLPFVVVWHSVFCFLA